MTIAAVIVNGLTRRLPASRFRPKPPNGLFIGRSNGLFPPEFPKMLITAKAYLSQVGNL
jgi:hypothetical protein